MRIILWTIKKNNKWFTNYSYIDNYKCENRVDYELWYLVIKHAEEWLYMNVTNNDKLSKEEKINIIFSHSRDDKNDFLYLIKSKMKENLNKLQNSMSGYQQMEFEDYESNKIKGYDLNQLQPVNPKDHHIYFKKISRSMKSLQFKCLTISNWISRIQYFKKNYNIPSKLFDIRGVLLYLHTSNIVQNTIL